MIGALFSMTMEINVAAWPIIFSSLASKQEIKAWREVTAHTILVVYLAGAIQTHYFSDSKQNVMHINLEAFPALKKQPCFVDSQPWHQVLIAKSLHKHGHPSTQ